MAITRSKSDEMMSALNNTLDEKKIAEAHETTPNIEDNDNILVNPSVRFVYPASSRAAKSHYINNKDNSYYSRVLTKFSLHYKMCIEDCFGRKPEDQIQILDSEGRHTPMKMK
jgi:hypothetical protein